MYLGGGGERIRLIRIVNRCRWLEVGEQWLLSACDGKGQTRRISYSAPPSRRAALTVKATLKLEYLPRNKSNSSGLHVNLQFYYDAWPLL